jgi:acetyl-CoA synthetase
MSQKTAKPQGGGASSEQSLQAGQVNTVMQEARLFPPTAEFSAKARIGSLAAYEAMWNEAAADTETFWKKLAGELHWFQPFTKTLEWKEPFASWFVGGKTNASYNCLDAHLNGPRRNKAALIWEGEPGEERTLTYQELHHEVCKFANVLKKLGMKQGDVASIYMPMTPELAIAMLACARIGVIHSVIFGGFSSEAIADRNNDAKAKMVITADGGWRRGQQLPLKASVDTALAKSPTVKHCVVLKRLGNHIHMQAGRDHWWHELMDDASADCPAEPLDSEAPLFILYTSGSTGKPKAILHTHGGYMVGTYATLKYCFDVKDEDRWWCTADPGWITGHSYLVYGPMLNGVTSFLFEGGPSYPEPNRWWQCIEKYGITIFYTAPTAIRGLMRYGDSWPSKHDLSSLRLLGTVGEPINPEAWKWYYKVIGNSKLPIIDTWWQTETGAFMIAPTPVVPLKPGSGTRPFFGQEAEIVDEQGKPVGDDTEGYLVLKNPWPSMLRTIYGDDERYANQYWSKYPGKYTTGDSAKRDKDGYFWIIGRVDDVIKVSGHRLGTAEVESALVSHPAVAEAAAIGLPHDVKGQAIYTFVMLRAGFTQSPELAEELRQHVSKTMGPIARPEEVKFVDKLPKTRSGKIMRRVLKARAQGLPEGDISTLEE